MKTLHIKKIVLILFSGLTFASAQGSMPSSAQIYFSATNFWYGNDLAGFTTYTTNLYSGATTNYIAPTLLSAFHDYVFLGELVSASNKYSRVQEKVSASPEQFTDMFKGMLSMVTTSIFDDIHRYNQANKPLNDAKALAAPQEIRDENAETPFILPHFLILSHSPDNIQLQ